MEYKPWIFRGLDAEQNGPASLREVSGLTIPSGGIGFFNREECQAIFDLTRHDHGRTAVTWDGLGTKSYSSRKSTIHEVYPHTSTSWIFEKLEAALAQLNRQQYNFAIQDFFEGAQIYEYPTGGHLDWHMDIAKGYMSNRKLSMSVQLSDADDYEGGDLEWNLLTMQRADPGVSVT